MVLEENGKRLPQRFKYRESTTTVEICGPDETADTDESPRIPSGSMLSLAEGTTSEREVGAEATPQESIAGTPWSILDRYVLSTGRIPGILVFLLVLVLCGIIIYHDSQAGRMLNWRDVINTLKKCVPVIIFSAILWSFFNFLPVLSQWAIRRWPGLPRGKNE